MSNRLTIKGQVTIPKAVRDFLGPRAASHCGVLALLAGGI